MGRHSSFIYNKFVSYDQKTNTCTCMDCGRLLKGKLLGNIKRHYLRIHRKNIGNTTWRKIIDPLEHNLSNSSQLVSGKGIQLGNKLQQVFTNEQVIPSTSQHEFTFPKIQNVQSLVTSDNAPEKTKDDHYKLNLRKRKTRHRNHNIPSLKKLCSVACELIQNEQHCEKNPGNSNLKSFGEYIDTELEKLDKATCAAVKMEIHKIIQQASIGTYKTHEIKVDDEQKQNDEDVCHLDEALTDHSYVEVLISSKPKISTENKENKIPSASVLSERQESQLTPNAEEEQTKRVKKKRPKSKDILTTIYDAIQTDTKQNKEQTVTFGAYVENELKSMDSLTVINVKLKICQILYKASLEKLKNEKDMEQTNKNNTKHSNAKQTNCNDENGQEKIDINDDDL